MRNSLTDSLGIKLQTAFLKSGLGAFEFVERLSEIRDIFDISNRDDKPSFHVIKDGEILTCYYSGTSWFCKF